MSQTFEVDPVAAALTRFGEGLHQQVAVEDERLTTYTTLAALEDQVVTAHDQEVLAPIRLLWDGTSNLLSGSVYRSAHVKDGGDTVIAWWGFDCPGFQDVAVGTGQMAVRVSVDVAASAPVDEQTGVPPALLRLMGALDHRNPALSGRQRVADARMLGLPLSSRARLPGGWWRADVPPSPATIHQLAGEWLLRVATRFDVSMYAAAPGQEREEVLRALLLRSHGHKPQGITFTNPTPGRHLEQLELSPKTVDMFLQAWRADAQKPGAQPTVQDLLDFMKECLPRPWESTKTFAGVVSHLGSYTLQATPGKPLASCHLADVRPARKR